MPVKTIIEPFRIKSIEAIRCTTREEREAASYNLFLVASESIQAEAAMNVTIDPKLKTKCPRTALGCVTAQVEAGASPAALLEEMKARENEIQKLAFPRGVLASPEVEATRMAYKALGKDPSRYFQSFEEEPGTK
jgi:hypothetical protein